MQLAASAVMTKSLRDKQELSSSAPMILVKGKVGRCQAYFHALPGKLGGAFFLPEWDSFSNRLYLQATTAIITT